MIEIAKGTKVKWTLKGGASGTGTTVTDSIDGKVLVAVETQSNRDITTTHFEEMHYVIWCNVTWLTVVE